MRRVATSVLIACFLTACGANEADTATTLTLPPSTSASSSESPSASPSSTSAAAPSRNERNNIVKQFGELARLVDPNRNEQASFTVDSIEVDPPCAGQFAGPAENGHLLVLNMRATTGPDLADLGGTFQVLANDWRVIGADGLTEANVATAAALSCLDDSEALPSQMGPGQQFVGKLVLDSRNASGVAIFAPPYVDGGWEWVF